VLNLVNLSKSWVASGQLGLGTALLGLHGSMLLLGLTLLWWRDRGTTWHWSQLVRMAR
jgi:lipopolysaccharide export system permease protein